MKPECWQRITQVFQAALECESGRREAFLKEACAGDESLRKEVDSLLACQAEAEGFIESPALEVAAKALAQDEVEKAGIALIGHTLSHYKILDKIGEGGMGVVYRAHDERLDRDVAIKVLQIGTLADAAARKRFRKEALALSKLNHPAIETVHDFDTQDGVDFLVIEYIPGTTLSDKVAEGPLPEKEILRLGVQLAEGLEAAHGQRIVHRDLKPANLRITPDGRLKLLDFGLAKLLRPPIEQGAGQSSTGVGVLMGTLPHMSPEQLEGKPVDCRTDIYAAGTVLYEMAVGHTPFGEAWGGRLADCILHQAPVPPGALNHRISAGLENIILKCLEKDPHRRYRSAKELGAELRRIAARSSLSFNRE
jgi:serine/threonine protein kinase